MKLKKPIIFFDLETTGVDTTKDRIVQIATIKLFPDGSQESKTYLINPEINIPKEASDVHGITDEMVKDSPTFKKYSKNLLKYFENSDIGGYNSNRFDVPLLIEEFRRCDLEFDIKRAYLDVMQIEQELNPRTLSGVYNRYMGKELEDAHDALNDVKATLEIFNCQTEKLSELKTVEEIDKFSQGDKPRVDLAGKLQIIDDEICWTFGKHKDKPITTDYQYASWVLTTSIPKETEDIIKNIIYKK